MWSLVLVLIIYWICVFFIILFDAMLSWTGKWLLTLLHTWHHNREIQWVTKGTHNTATGRLWVQVLSLFPRLQSFIYCCFHYCYIYPSRCLLPLHWFPLFKIKLTFQRNIKKVENQYYWPKKNVPRKIKSIKHSSIMRFSLDIIAWWTPELRASTSSVKKVNPASDM